MTTTYANIESAIEQGTTHWLARILEPGKEPYYFVPDAHAHIVTKGDLVRAVNKAHPGVTYVSTEVFNAKVAANEDDKNDAIQVRAW